MFFDPGSINQNISMQFPTIPHPVAVINSIGPSVHLGGWSALLTFFLLWVDLLFLLAEDNLTRWI